jgi:hypothetical protein
MNAELPIFGALIIIGWAIGCLAGYYWVYRYVKRRYR